MLRIIFFVSTLLLTSCSNAQEISIELFVQGLSSPVDMAHAGDDRIFIVEQSGKIKIVNPDGSVNTEPFLDLSSLISTGGERGLLGLAFAPDYDETGRFYVNYTNLSGDTVIERYHVSGNPDIADETGTGLLTIEQPFTNHNGGNIHFGPDGYLWISSGDGGSGGDPNGNGQNTGVLLGKILRIDVSGPTYTIPSDNPFAESGGAPEVWAYGLRNPWKFSFDRQNDELLIADVGQSNYEEINRQPSSLPGLNYGWRCYEGNEPYNTSGCGSADDMIFPAVVYSHNNGRCSITGGYVYRGSQFSNLTGKYFFGDYCSGEIGWMSEDNDFEFILDSGINITSFGEDAAGELYVLGSGKVFKLIGQTMHIDQNSYNNLKIFPNPVRDFLYFESDIPIELTSIYSIDGRLIKELKSTQNRADLSDLGTGIYIIKVISKDSVHNLKIYKE